MALVRAVSKKGQITIPKRLREKYRIKDKVLMEELEKGIVLKPWPSLCEERGSLKEVFKGKTARQLLDEAREDESAEDSARTR